MAGKQSKIEVILSAKDTGLSAALKRGQADLRTFAGQVRSATAPLGSMVSAALSLKTALAGIVAGAGVTALGKSLLTAGQEMDRLRLAFGSISGSSQGAAKDMDFVRATAGKLGLDLQSAAQAYKGISAAAQGTELSGKGVRDIFTSVSKASTVLGLSADETSGALLAISQMISKGKVSAEELRGQLGERLPGAFQIAAQAMGVTTAEFDKMMANGQIMADDFIPKFSAALEQRFGGAATKAANSFTAASNRMSSELFLLQSALGQAVTNNTFFVEAMGKGSALLKGLSTDATANAASWRQWAKESALSVLGFVADSSQGFNDVYKSLSVLGGSLKLASAGVLSLSGAFQALFEKAARLTGSTENVKYWSDAQTETMRLIDQAMSGAVKSFDNAEQGSKTLETITTRITQLKKELEKVKADEVNPVEGVAKKAEVEFKQVGGKWVAVEKQIQQANQETTKQVGIDWGKVWTDFEKNGLSAAEAVDSALNQAARDREVTLRINEVQQRATGGLIQRLARGGKLPGYGGGDRISALLEAGEFVIRKEAVARFGSGLFHALNNLQLPDLSRFAQGGMVGAGAAGDSMTINFAFGGDGSYPVTTTKETAIQLEREFRRRAVRSSR